MRKALLGPALALVIASPPAHAQGPWGNVKGWAGTITITAVDSGTRPGMTWKTTYSATGPVTLVDNMMPDGSHMMWPMAGAEDLSDPLKIEALTKPWRAHVTGHFEARGVDEAGQPFSQSCVADSTMAAVAGLVISPTTPTYVFQANAPRASFRCSGPPGTPTPILGLPGAISLTGPRGAPGPISGSKDFTDSRSPTTVSFQLSPTK